MTFRHAVLACWLCALTPVTGLASADAPFTGTWSGSFEIHYTDGRIENGTAWVVLEQSGQRVTGTAGPTADRQQAIRSGTVSGARLTFTAPSSKGKVLTVTLTRAGERLAGDAVGEIGDDKVRGVLDLAPVGNTNAPAVDPLYQKLLALDTALFDSFNRCADPAQLAKHATYFAKDVEFYHDLAGVEWGVGSMLENTRNNVCGKFRRELDAASFRVYPIPKYGAMTMGTHRFCHTPTTCEGAGEFTMVWKQTGDQWQVTRVLSFAHRALDVAPAGR